MTTAIFLGSPEAAVPALETLAEMVHVSGVVTQPGRRKGRGRNVRPTPVAEAAAEFGLPTHEVASTDELRSVDFECDVAVVAAFGMIIPGDVLARPRRGFVNIHFSLLPAWRGAAPVERAILAGDERTGVCIMQMDEGLDTGPVFARSACPIGRESAGELTSTLAGRGAALLGSVLAGILDGSLAAEPQVGEASYARKVASAEARLDPRDTTLALDRRIRAFAPRPGAWFETNEGRLKIAKAQPDEGTVTVGELRMVEGRLVVGTGDGALRLLEVQVPGGRALPGEAWANGRRNAFPTLTP